MNENKEIEEMASTMAECNTTCDECFEKLERVMTMKIKERENYCQAYLFAQRLYNAGYRNVKDKAREIFDTIIKALEERKERVKAFYGVTESVGADVAIRTVKEIAKEYGVEIKE